MNKTSKIDISAKVTGHSKGEIIVYGYITDDKFDETDVTPTEFNKAINQLSATAKEITVRVNSGGGSVPAGQTMASMIDTARSRGTYFIADVEGLAGSMAAGFIHACDKVVQHKNAMQFYHRVQSYARGTADDMLEAADMMEKWEKTYIGLMMRRFKGTEAEALEILRNNSWFTAEEAYELGLCDEIAEPIEIAACVGGYDVNGIVVPTDALKGAADKIQIHETDGGENEMIFNKELDAKIKALADEGKSIAIEKNGDNYAVSEMLTAKAETAVAILTAEDVQGVSMLEDASGDTVLAALKDLVDAGIDVKAVAAGLAEYKKPDPALTAKAEKFDTLFASEVTEAIKNGVRAKGDSFKAERWTKILNDFSIDEVRAQSEEWANEADAVLHGGEGRLSRVPSVGVSAISTNLDDYDL